jgi:hypothetical protein
MEGPVLFATSPACGAVAQDGPVKDPDDVLIAEIEAVGRWGLVQGIKHGDNGFVQLVFHDESPVGDASGVIMDTNCFLSKGFRSFMQKAVTLQARKQTRGGTDFAHIIT